MAVLKDLIVHGNSRFLNGAHFDTINAQSIGADTGIFKKLIATTLEAETASIDDLTAQNATVVGLLDVQGQLHTNSWTQSNIATIDGSFFITPTVSVQEGTFTYSPTANSNKGQITLNAKTNYSFGIDGNWTTGSLVMITGQVADSDAMKPLGTIRGVLYSANANTIIINGSFSDAVGNNCAVLQELGAITSADGKDLKVSLYQKSITGGLAPLGIYMTSGGMNTQNISFIDIYNGGNATSTAPTTGGISSGAFALPVLRIGNLAGLPAINGNTPTGYGIYTTNGYFSGVIVSTVGKIANFTLSGSKLYSNNHSAYNTAVTGIYIGDDYISFGSGGVTYFNVNGTGKIGPWTLTTTAFYNAKSSYNNSNAGVYIGKDYIAGGAGEKWWFKSDGSAKIGAMTLTSAGVLSVPAANISTKLTASQIEVGDLNAFGATIGGFKIETNSLHTNNVAITSNADNSIGLSTSDFTRTISSKSRSGLRFAIGDKFAITGDGTLYAGGWIIDSASIYKSSDVTSGTASTQYQAHLYAPATIAADTIAYRARYRSYDGGNNSYTNSDGTTSSYSGWTTPFYVRYDGYMVATSANITGTINATSGYFKNIEIRNSNNATVAKLVSNQLTFYYNSSGTTVQKVADVGADGMIFYRNGSKRAATTANGLTIYGSDGATTVANFGATAQIGVAANSKSRVLINAGNIQIINRSSDGADIALTTTTGGMWTEANATTTTAGSGAILPSTYIRAGIQFSRPNPTTGQYGIEGKAFYAGCWAPAGETIGNRANFYVHQDGWMKVRSIVLASSITGTDSSGYSYSDCNIYILLDVNAAASSTANATSGADAGLFNAIRALGWYSDMIVPT